ncbi:AMP-binding protein [Streptomyces sp. M19]
MSHHTYVELILDALAADRARQAVTDADGRTVTAGAFHDDVHRTAAELAEHGIGRGATVALLTGDRPEALTARYAANLLGARVVFLYEGMAARTLAAVLASVEPSALLVDPTLPGSGRRSGAAARTGRAVLRPEPVRRGPDGAFAAAHGRLVARRRGRRTTGASVTRAAPPASPGVRMAHGPYARTFVEGQGLGGDPAPCFLVCTSLAHLSGIIADHVLWAGGRLVIQRSFVPAEVLAAVERERITDLWLLPPLLYRLLDEPTLAGTDLSSLRRVMYGGTAASAARLRQAIEVFGPVLNGFYGQSEAGLITAVAPAEHGVTGRAGRSRRAVRCPGGRGDPGHERPSGRAGRVRRDHGAHPQLMSGYWKQPELTAEVLTDGWVRTGDVGYLDGAGHLFIVDRIKEMIVVVGAMCTPPSWRNCCSPTRRWRTARCSGARRGRYRGGAGGGRPGGRAPRGPGVAAVVRHGAQGPDVRPSALYVVDRIPLTTAGKPDRQRLRALPTADAG